MHQAHHAVGNRHCDTGGNQSPLPGCQFDVLGAVEINAGVAVVGPGGQGQVAVQSNHRETGGHDPTDYPWPGVWFARQSRKPCVSRAVVGAVVVVADRLWACRRCWPPR